MNNSMGLKFDSSVFFLVTQKFSSRIRFFVLFDFTRYFLDIHSQILDFFFVKLLKASWQICDFTEYLGPYLSLKGIVIIEKMEFQFSFLQTT